VHQNEEGTLPRKRERERERERKQKSGILGKHKKECGILRCNAKLLSTRGSKSTRQTLVVSRSRRDIPRGIWARGVLTRRYGPVFFLFSFFFFAFPQICEVALRGLVIIFFNFLKLRHWLNPQRNLALNGDRFFLDNKTLV
jgi:hypothetical protein